MEHGWDEYQCDGDILSAYRCTNMVRVYDPYGTVAIVLCSSCNGGTAAGPVLLAE